MNINKHKLNMRFITKKNGLRKLAYYKKKYIKKVEVK